jgi:7-keto-8-aminopelargonate synthetase-like enzyme
MMTTEPTRECFKFAGNDYLGLATHPSVTEALLDRFEAAVLSWEQRQ